MLKKILYTILFVILMVSGCGKTEKDKTNSVSGKKIGLVFDVGGKGDKSFNDAAAKGLDSAKKILGIETIIIDPGEGFDRESALRKLASNPEVGLIFGVGFIFTDDINAVSKEFPDKKFVCIDYSVGAQKNIAGNLKAIDFKEQEGCFLIGVLAGLLTKSNNVGFIGGMESPLIKKFETGYSDGIKYINPKCNVKIAYVGVIGEAFKNPGKAKEIALSQYNSNSDIIFHASGLSGMGLFEAVKETKKLAIGVDLDQYGEAPGFVLTSMTKQVTSVVFDAIKEFITGNFKTGVYTLGLKEKGIDYVYDDNNKNLIPKDIRKKVEEVRNKIISGEIIVKDKP
jgi:basic membrane protein A